MAELQSRAEEADTAREQAQMDFEQQALDAEIASDRARLQMAGRETALRERSLDMEEQQLEQLRVGRQKYAANVKLDLEAGVFGDPATDERSAQIAQMVPLIESGEAGPEDIAKLDRLRTQAQESARMLESVRMKRQMAMQSVQEGLAANPHDEELQQLLTDVQTGAVDPEEARVIAVTKAQNLGPAIEQMVQQRVQQALAAVGGATPLGAAPGLAAAQAFQARGPLSAQGLEQARERGLLRPLSELGSKGDATVQAIADAMDSDAGAGQLIEIALDAGLDPNDTELANAIRSRREAAEKEADVEKAKRPQKMAAFRQKVRTLAMLPNGAARIAEAARNSGLDLTQEELQEVMRQEGALGIGAEFE